jgi:hypothetical protein
MEVIGARGRDPAAEGLPASVTWLLHAVHFVFDIYMKSMFLGGIVVIRGR